LLLAIAFLSELGLAPYDVLFPAYLTRLAGSVVATSALAVGAAVELLFLIGLARFTRRAHASSLLAVACLASVARWTILAFVTAPPVLVATQILHALSFGAFYVASVTLVNEESPAPLRATGQGIFRAFTFGIAPAVAVFLAGRVERAGELRPVFLVAAGGAVVAFGLAMKVRADSRGIGPTQA
jgi:MFS transporter, PPP family, 3-phenylpropionic acid transporter